MARKKITDEKVLKTWEDVDLTLKEIAQAELELERITTDMNSKIHDIKLEAEVNASPLREKIERLGLYVKDYVQDNKAELRGKTKQLNFGKTGFRMSTKIVVKKAEEVLKSLKKFAMMDCVTVKESINKDVLKKYSENDILKVGATLKKEDAFWYETEREKLYPAE